MKKLMIYFLLFIVSMMAVAGCNSGSEPPQQNPTPPSIPASIQQAQRTSGSFQMACGTNQATTSFQIHTPLNWNGQFFAVLLSGSPADEYLSQTFQAQVTLLSITPGSENYARQLAMNPDPYLGLLGGLLTQGYKVLEVKYARNPISCTPMLYASGFYSLCCHQGLPAITAHNIALYDEIVTRLRFDRNNPSHQLIGFGYSLGGIQLEQMAFVAGKPFAKIGLTGVLAGNSVQGCTDGRLGHFNGLGWHGEFLDYADAITTSGEGCSGGPSRLAPLEYSTAHNFDSFRYRTRWDLSLFEGERLTTLPYGDDTQDPVGFHGNLAQAELIRDLRQTSAQVIDQRGQATTVTAAPDATYLQSYPGCGHEILFCTRGHALQDILARFNPSRLSTDTGLPESPTPLR